VTDPAAALTDPAKRRLALTLQYDGSAFHGWQSQPDAVTVQSTLEDVLSTLFAEPTRVVAAGRTDAGVHATGQVASVDAPAKWAPEDLLRAANALLPGSVLVTDVVPVADDFHARFSAVARGYAYRLGLAPESRSPFVRPFCWPLGEPLARGVLDDAAAALRGPGSFAAFAKAGQEERGHRCTVHVAAWHDWAGFGLTFHVVADRFLHHMVRYLVGTMVEMARGARPAEDLATLLAAGPGQVTSSGARPGEVTSSAAGPGQVTSSAARPGLVTSPPAPPGGLFLARVYYEADDVARDARSGAPPTLPIP